MMTKRTLTVAAIAAAVVTAGGVGTAFAATSGNTPAPPAATSPAAAPVQHKAPTPGVPDTDSVQQGDQSGPDATAEPAEAAGPESATAGDGPGGHQDPPGAVDNQTDFAG